MSEADVAARAPSFFDLYARGEASAGDIHGFIGRGHDAQEPWAQDMELHEYLGLTRTEYEVWLYDPFSLPCILRARRPGEGLIEIMAERYAQLCAADRREDRTIILSLGNWLQRQHRQ